MGGTRLQSVQIGYRDECESLWPERLRHAAGPANTER